MTAERFLHRSSRTMLCDRSCSLWPVTVGLLQVYINGEFVGGSDLLMGLHQSGELGKLVEENDAKS